MSYTPGGGGSYDGNPIIIIQDSSHRFITDAEKAAWDSKQNALGFTPCNTTDSRLSDARTPLAHTHTSISITDFATAVAALITGKQDLLVSATNIKTINGQNVLCTGDLAVNSGYHFVGTLAGDQATGANTTPVTLTGLVFNYVANSKYRIWAMGRVSPAAATTGCGFQFDLSSAITSIDVQFFHQLANTGTLSGGHSIADDSSAGVSSGMPANAGTYPIALFGFLTTGANAGTAQLRFRSETTAVTTCKTGFTLVVEKIV